MQNNVPHTTPWGSWEVLLEAPYCKVKQICVNAGQRLSYQKHAHREELWTLVQGQATLTLDGVVSIHSEGDVIHIPKGAAHRVANSQEIPLIFIEIQRGTYFGEDDIVRLSDDYGRT